MTLLLQESTTLSCALSLDQTHSTSPSTISGSKLTPVGHQLVQTHPSSPLTPWSCLTLDNTAVKSLSPPAFYHRTLLSLANTIVSSLSVSLQMEVCHLSNYFLSVNLKQLYRCTSLEHCEHCIYLTIYTVELFPYCTVAVY